MHLVLDGLEDRPYKPAHKVQLFGGVPYWGVAKWLNAAGFDPAMHDAVVGSNPTTPAN